MDGRHSQETVHNLVGRARAAIAGTNVNSDDDFDVVQQTFRSFRRRRDTEASQRTSKRGRKFHVEWKATTFLMRRSNPDYFPSPAECRFLKEQHFGTPDNQAEPFNRNWTIEMLKTKISELYPDKSLGVVGFRFGRCDKGKKIHIIEPANIRDLEKEVGRGKLLIIPNSDIGLTLNDSNNEVEESGTPTVTFNTQQRQSRPSISTLTRGTAATTAVATAASTSTERHVASASSSLPMAPASLLPAIVTSPALSNTSESATHTLSATGTSTSSSRHAEPSEVALELQEESDGELPDFELDFDEDDDDETSIPRDAATAKLAAEVKEMFVTLHTSLLDEEEVSVRRDYIVQDVLKLYEEPDICQRRLKVTFDGELGSDFGGLTKEMCTQFWKKVSEVFFQGEHTTVPYLPLYRLRKEKSKYVAIGRALTHTVALTESLPCRLSRSGIISMIFQDVNTELLLEDFLLYVTDSEKRLLTKAMTDFDSLTEKETERLETFFCVHDLSEQPKRNEIKDQVLAIAEEFLVKRPSQLFALMKQGIPETHKEMFWHQLSVDHITFIMHSQRPTRGKVLKALKTSQEDLRQGELTVFYFLKEYIRSLKMDELLDFLLFTTASIHTPHDKIIVSFVNTFGIARRPVSHTCNNLLELSKNYHSSQEFERDMKAYLKDPDSYKYTIM